MDSTKFTTAVPVNKVRMPKKVKAGPHVIEILTDTDSLEAHQHETGKTIYGYCDTSELKIFIWPRLPASIAKTTIIHELLHLIYPSEVHLLFEKPDETEEFLVENLSGKLLSLLSDNPQLVKWLLS